MVDLEKPTFGTKYIDRFCVSKSRERFALEYLFKLEKEGKAKILELSEYHTPKGDYFVVATYLYSGDNPVRELLEDD